MSVKIPYAFNATIWQHPAEGGWFFVSLPAELASEIRQHSKWKEEGWGRLKVTAKIGENAWATAMWFDTKQQTYLLPIKKLIREKGQLEINQNIDVVVWI